MTLFKALLPAVLLLNSTALLAQTGVEQLQSFTKELTTFAGDFNQVVYGSDDKPIQESNGHMTLKRPGKFFWEYTDPAPQTIVADGQKVWVYDKDLAQVTVRSIDTELGNTPILLLGSGTPLESQFDLTDLGSSASIAWVELKPKQDSKDFETVYLGMVDGALAVMELRDNFGQATQIKFNNTSLNQTVDDSMFQFVPPEGTDVIGEQ